MKVNGKERVMKVSSVIIMITAIAVFSLFSAYCAPSTPPPPAAPAATPTAPATQPPSAAAAATPTTELVTPEKLRSQLYEAAKKEGKVMVYTAGTTADFEHYSKAFSERFPGVTAEAFTAVGESLTEKALMEARAGKQTADVVFVGENMVPLLEGGLVEKWAPPESASFPNWANDPEGLWHYSDTIIHVMMFNTNLVPKEKEPKRYEDLLDPFFRGKLGLESEAYSWFTQTLAKMGSGGLDFMKRLAAQQPTPIKGHTKLSDMVVSGETVVAVNVYHYMAQQQMDKGAPVKWAAVEPAGQEPNGFMLMKNAPHPNAAKLFIDWRLSPEGQTITATKLGRNPLRIGAEVGRPEFNIKVRPLSYKERAVDIPNNRQSFKEIFGLLR